MEEIKKIAERKARIRNEAYWNMKGIVENDYSYIKLNSKQINQLNEEIGQRIQFISENAVLVPHKALIEKKQFSVKVFCKKVIRKLAEKILGWYYLPLIEQQTVYNQYTNETLKEMQKIIVNQTEKIQELEKKLKLANEGVKDEE